MNQYPAAYLSDLTTLVISSYQGDSIWVSDFKGKQQQKRLHRIKSSVDEVAHEEIVGVWDIAPHSEEFFEVVELPMNIAAHLGIARTRITLLPK